MYKLSIGTTVEKFICCNETYLQWTTNKGITPLKTSTKLNQIDNPAIILAFVGKRTTLLFTVAENLIQVHSNILFRVSSGKRQKIVKFCNCPKSLTAYHLRGVGEEFNFGRKASCSSNLVSSIWRVVMADLDQRIQT